MDELLSAPRSQLASIEDKVKELSKQGIISHQSTVEAEEFVEKNKRGILVFGATTAAILLLLVYLSDKRRRH